MQTLFRSDLFFGILRLLLKQIEINGFDVKDPRRSKEITARSVGALFVVNREPLGQLLNHILYIINI